MKNIVIYTNVYNGEKTIAQTIESVLGQSYSNFEYHILDNGSTDGTRQIIESFAKKDPRLVLHIRDTNSVFDGDPPPYYLFAQSLAEAPDGYVAAIDGDDWWAPAYLERLIGFLEANDLDIAVTGTIAHQGEEESVLRKLPLPVILSQQEFAAQYPFLWTYPSTYWGCVMRQEAIPHLSREMLLSLRTSYGADTIYMLHCLRCCRRVGIDNSALYHYRIYPQSVSYRYDPRRFDANLAYYDAIRDFLMLHNTLDPTKQEWLKRVHLASMGETLRLLWSAELPAPDKLVECARITAHPLTGLALTNDCVERKTWYDLLRAILAEHAGNADIEFDALKTIIAQISPRCAAAVTAESLSLFLREPVLFSALLQDDWDRLVETFFRFIVEMKYTKQFDLGTILGSLVPEKTPLSGMKNARFFREYQEVCILILSENYVSALDSMTGLLLEKNKLYGEEAFLQIYLSLAALENQVTAFLFGKIRLASLYLREGRKDECRIVLDELAEMGANEQEEVLKLREKMDASL